MAVGDETTREPESPEAAEAADLAGELADPERLMEGENPDTEDLEDAEHWLSVYKELMAFKQELLEKLRSRLQTMNASDAHDEVLADERMLELELARFARRQEFWRVRIAELSSGAG